MAARIIAIALLVMTLAIALALLAIIFMGPREGAGLALRSDEQPTGGTPIEHLFSGHVGQWRLQGESAIVSTGAYHLLFGLSEKAGQPAPPSIVPLVQVDMVDHAMEPKLPQVELEESGDTERRAASSWKSVGDFELSSRKEASA